MGRAVNAADSFTWDWGLSARAATVVVMKNSRRERAVKRSAIGPPSAEQREFSGAWSELHGPMTCSMAWSYFSQSTHAWAGLAEAESAGQAKGEPELPDPGTGDRADSNVSFFLATPCSTGTRPLRG